MWILLDLGWKGYRRYQIIRQELPITLYLVRVNGESVRYPGATLGETQGSQLTMHGSWGDPKGRNLATLGEPGAVLRVSPRVAIDPEGR